MRQVTRFAFSVAAIALLASCGGSRDLTPTGDNPLESPGDRALSDDGTGRRTTIWDAFRPSRVENTVQVNRYIWRASLDVLNFLPIQTVDPYTGVIVTGYGRPPGGGKAYRATILVSDPALEARSLKVALATRSGPVAGATQRAVEDAILARARQLRIADSRF